MCRNCEENERQHLTDIAFANPRPCLVCGSRHVIGVGTWRPDETKRIAAGGTEKTDPMFAYWLCREHAAPTEENGKLIQQTILREVQLGNTYRIGEDYGR